MLYRARFAVESGWRQRGEWNGEWSGMGIRIQRSSWTVRMCNSGLAGRNVAGVHKGVDGSNGVLAVADMLFLATATVSADSFQCPGRADFFASVLGDLYLVALSHG